VVLRHVVGADRAAPHVVIAASFLFRSCRFGRVRRPLLLALGAFLMQVAVQGAWGVHPGASQRLSPHEARARFRASFISSAICCVGECDDPCRSAVHFGGNYGLALSSSPAGVAIIIALLTASVLKRGHQV